MNRHTWIFSVSNNSHKKPFLFGKVNCTRIQPLNIKWNSEGVSLLRLPYSYLQSSNEVCEDFARIRLVGVK